MEEVRTQLEDGVLEVTLNRPARRNALTAVMYSALAEVLVQAEVNDDVRAIAFVGEGKDFCAGNDIQEFLGAYDLAAGSPWRRFLDALPSMTKPLVAAVQGNAVGIGLTMLLHFDLVYLEPNAQLAAPFAKLGVVPEAASSELLPRLIGRVRANEVFLLGQALDAVEAVRLGIANAVVVEGTSRITALAAARTVAQLPSGAARGVKRLLRMPSGGPLSHRIDAECTLFMQRIRAADTRKIIHSLAAPRTAP